MKLGLVAIIISAGAKRGEVLAEPQRGFGMFRGSGSVQSPRKLQGGDECVDPTDDICYCECEPGCVDDSQCPEGGVCFLRDDYHYASDGDKVPTCDDGPLCGDHPGEDVNGWWKYEDGVNVCVSSVPESWPKYQEVEGEGCVNPTDDKCYCECSAGCVDDSQCPDGFVCFLRDDIHYASDGDKVPTCDDGPLCGWTPPDWDFDHWKYEDGANVCVSDGASLESWPKYLNVVSNRNCPPDPAVVKYAINSGNAGAYTAADGTVYQADAYFDGGDTFNSAGDVDDTEDDKLYRSERNSGDGDEFGYHLPVTPGKSYKVTLKFAEVWKKIDNVDKQRVFSVFVEDQPVVENLDIYAMVGARTALNLEHTYVAKDDSLDIRFVNVVQKAKVSALLVEDLSSCLGRCEGNCETDLECEDGLRCFKREPGATDAVPHCEGGENDDPGKNYCTRRDHNYFGLWLSKVADNLDEDPPNRDDGTSVFDYPLLDCEGDCDSDDHCGYALYCFERDGNEDVPDCMNRGGDPGEDYCVPAPPTQIYTTECTLPCSWGSCNILDSPWQTEQFEGGPLRQEFRVNLKKGWDYEIQVVRESCAFKPKWYLKTKEGYSLGEWKMADPPVDDACGDPQMTLLVTETDLGFDRTEPFQEYTIEVGNDSTDVCPSGGFKYTLKVRDLWSEEDVTYVDPSCQEPPQRAVVKCELGGIDSAPCSSRHCFDWEEGAVDFSFVARHNDDLEPRGYFLHQTYGRDPEDPPIMPGTCSWPGRTCDLFEGQTIDWLFINTASNGLTDSNGRLLQGCGRVFGSARFTESYPRYDPYDEPTMTFDLIVFDNKGEQPDAYQLNVVSKSGTDPWYLLEDVAVDITDGDIITRIKN